MQAHEQLQRREIADFSNANVMLSYYLPGSKMPSHAHEAAQYSVILSGALAEDTASHSHHTPSMHIGYKPAGLFHENRYGPNGALILAVNTVSNELPLHYGWRKIAQPKLLGSMVRALLREGRENRQLVDDICAFATNEPRRTRVNGVPRWLQSLREAIKEEPAGIDVQSVASTLGIHRVSLSRAYSSAFGVPISLEIRRSRLSHAVRGLLEQRLSIADAAVEAGFTDQSHFTRWLVHDAGVTPGQLSRMMR